MPQEHQSDSRLPVVFLNFVGFQLSPDAVTEALQVKPTSTNVSLVRNCGTNRKEECGLWSYSSAEKVSSPALADHIEHVLRLFTPLKPRIDELMPVPRIILQVTTTEAVRLEERQVAGIAALGAALQIYPMGR